MDELTCCRYEDFAQALATRPARPSWSKSTASSAAEATPARPLGLLAVFAHPDDETFRCGGTLALLARRGVRVHVLAATRGEGGSCGDPPLCRPEELPAVRERELHCACAALGIEPPRILDYRDGHLNEVNPEELIAEILDAVQAIQPQVMVTFGLDRLSGHLMWDIALVTS